MYFACPNPDKASRLVAAHFSPRVRAHQLLCCSRTSVKNKKMPRCVIINCDSPNIPNTQRQEHISYHSFPHDPIIKEKWIAATGRKDWFPTKHSTICSVHFEKNSFIEGKKLRLLKKTACPTIGILKLIGNEAENKDTPQKPSSLSRKRKLEKDDYEQPTSGGKCVTKKKLLNKINNAQEKIKQQNKLIKRLREQNRRKVNKILTLMTLLNCLKNKSLINDEQANLLQSTNVTTQEIYSRQQKNKNKISRSKYSPAVRSLSKTI